MYNTQEGKAQVYTIYAYCPGKKVDKLWILTKAGPILYNN